MSKAGILIVEDSFIVSYHLQKTLENEGYKVLTHVDTGEKGLEFLKTNKADLVLMDVMLNGEMDGIEAATIIKKKYDIPVVYITALSDKDTVFRAKITEPYGFLTKPFEDREICTTIEMAIYKHDIELRLKQSEDKYFSTVRSISDAVVTINGDFQITYMNPSAESVTGWVLGDALGLTIEKVLQLKDADTEQFNVNPVQCSLKSSRMNSMPDGLILRSRDNYLKPIGEGSMSPIIDKSGRFSGMVLVFKDISEKLAHDRLVKELDTQRLAGLLQGQERERSRIAKDLHDGLGQMLNAIKMHVNFIVKDKPGANDLNKLIDEAIIESVRISENLLPSKLKDFDLATCIRSLCKQLSISTHSRIYFQSLGRSTELEQSQKINFYRIAQEGINNAIKHANANTINVLLDEESHRIQLSIEDDGRGMNLNTVWYDHHAHHGLVNMRERIEIMGGKLTMESDPNRGTLIVAEAPLLHVKPHEQIIGSAKS
ncbi:MAG TPA: response regulator [Cyclobacteriaceae bacterium]